MPPIIHCLIPARQGSKGIPNKNIRLLHNKPLIAYSIELAIQSSYLQKVIVTTDSLQYSQIAQEYGAEVPFLRPVEISQDYSTDIEFMNHYLEWLQNNNQKLPDAILHLRPTFPFRKLIDLNRFIEKFIENWEHYDSGRSVISSNKSPYKMYQILDDDLVPLYHCVNDLIEPYNQPRQRLPEIFLHNGCYDIVKTNVILDQKSISGERIMPYMMLEEDNLDIDTVLDFEKAEKKQV